MNTYTQYIHTTSALPALCPPPQTQNAQILCSVNRLAMYSAFFKPFAKVSIKPIQNTSNVIFIYSFICVYCTAWPTP